MDKTAMYKSLIVKLTLKKMTDWNVAMIITQY